MILFICPYEVRLIFPLAPQGCVCILQTQPYFAIAIAFAAAVVVSHLPAGCRIDASASHPLNSASASQPPSRARCLLSSGASPPICLSFAGWLLRCLLSCASASSHLLKRSRLTGPSLTPPSLFTPASCCIASLCTASASQCATALHLAVSSSSLMSTSVAIIIVIISRHAIAIVVDFVSQWYSCRNHR